MQLYQFNSTVITQFHSQEHLLQL